MRLRGYSRWKSQRAYAHHGICLKQPALVTQIMCNSFWHSLNSSLYLYSCSAHILPSTYLALFSLVTIAGLCMLFHLVAYHEAIGLHV